MSSEIKTSLSLIVIRSADITATTEFYHALGLSFTREQHNSGPVHYSSVINEMVFEIYPLKKNGNHDLTVQDSMMIGLTVGSLAAVLANLAGIGIHPNCLSQDSEWGKWIKITDPDGRFVRIVEKQTDNSQQQTL